MLAAVVTVFDVPPPPSASSRGATGEEPHAFTPVVRSVVAAVMRLPQDHPDVDDGVSETMRRALEGRHRLRAGEPLRPWLCGIARNVAIDTLRRRGRERPVSALATDRDSSGDVSVIDAVVDSSPSALDRIEHENQVALVRRAMRDLPEGMREALVLFHVDGLGYDAIASKMKIPLGTVATWIARGRKTLAERMTALEGTRGRNS